MKSRSEERLGGERMIPRDEFERLFRGIGVEGDYDRFSLYCGLLQEWNQKMNLTAITDDEGVAVKHFADSVLPLTLCPVPAGAKVIDVGTGAGFPSIPMKLVRDDFELTLLDSLRKRLDFLWAVCRELEVTAELVHARAEDGGREAQYRESFDLAVSRAVAGLDLLAEYCLPFVRVGGIFLALKGSGGREEAAAGAQAVALCGGAIQEIKDYSLPNGDKRTLIIIEKVLATPGRYPRTAQRIKKEGAL